MIEPDMILQGVSYVLASKAQQMLDTGRELERQFREMRSDRDRLAAEVKVGDQRIDGAWRQLAEARATKDMHKERAQELEAKLAEAEKQRDEAEARLTDLLDADTAANAAAAVQEIADEVRARFTDRGTGLDPACAAGTCDCKSKLAPLPKATHKFTFDEPQPDVDDEQDANIELCAKGVQELRERTDMLKDDLDQLRYRLRKLEGKQ